MKARLHYLLIGFAMLVFGCNKNNDPSNSINYVRNIDTVKLIHVSADTTYVSLEPLEEVFVPPVHFVKLDNIFEETFDSLYLDIQKDNKIQFGSGVILPNIKFEIEGYDPFVFPYRTIQIKSYQTQEAFSSPILPTAFRDSTSNREINGYTLKRHYRRVSFIADVELIAKDRKGNNIKLSGQLKGSKVTRQYYNINLY